MNANRKIRRQREPMTALGRLEAGLQTQDESAWYAARLERLGRLMFGDLWESGERKAASAETECP